MSAGTAPDGAGWLDTLAARLVRARRSGRAIDAGGLDRPRTIAEALQVQELVGRALGASVEGWKIAIGRDGAPLAAHLLAMPDAAPEIALVGPLEIEVEIAVSLGRDLSTSPGCARRREAVLAAVDGVFIGIEIVRSRFADPAGTAPMLLMADHLANDGYRLGSPLPQHTLEPGALTTTACAVSSAGRTLHAAPALHPAGDPLAPMVAWLGAIGTPEMTLQAGQIVTTGSLCGVVRVTVPGPVLASLDGLGEARLTIV